MVWYVIYYIDYVYYIIPYYRVEGAGSTEDTREGQGQKDKGGPWRREWERGAGEGSGIGSGRGSEDRDRG